MKSEVIELIYRIASKAMSLGKDLSLEQKEYYTDSDGFGDGVGSDRAEDNGLILRVWDSNEDEEEEDQDEPERKHDVTEFELSAPVVKVEAGGSADGE